MNVKVKAIYLSPGAECTKHGEIEMDESEVDDYADKLAKQYKHGTLQVFVNDKLHSNYMSVCGI